MTKICKNCGHNCHCNKECVKCVNDVCITCACKSKIPT